MKTTTPPSCLHRNAAKPVLVPLRIGPEENDALERLAEFEHRSKSAMARIIYRTGLQAYQELQQVGKERKRRK